MLFTQMIQTQVKLLLAYSLPSPPDIKICFLIKVITPGQDSYSSWFGCQLDNPIMPNCANAWSGLPDEIWHTKVKRVDARSDMTNFIWQPWLWRQQNWPDRLGIPSVVDFYFRYILTARIFIYIITATIFSMGRLQSINSLIRTTVDVIVFMTAILKLFCKIRYRG
jgi:hypothetical protein